MSKREVIDVRDISDEDMRDLLTAKDVGAGRSRLKRILRALTPAAPASYRRIYDKMQRGKVSADDRTESEAGQKGRPSGGMCK